MSIKLHLPNMTELTPRITVIGVGGAGGNAINNMIAQGLDGVDFIAANTDAQALQSSNAEHRIQLGAALTEGLGAGSKPAIGEAAAEEAIEEIRAAVAGSHMVFIAAGMGGGTGTGAAAVIARTAKEMHILTVGVVTKPFHFEGNRRMRMAEAGILELRQHVDTLIVIPNQNLFRIANDKTTFADAFILADQVLHSGIACVTDLVVREGLINLDFADVRAVLAGMGAAMMGTGEATGDNRATEAAELAINNPLLDDISLSGAQGLLVSISGDRGLTLYEVNAAANRIKSEVDPEANIIVGATFDDSLNGRVRVSIVASGLAGSVLHVPLRDNRAAPVAGQSMGQLTAWHDGRVLQPERGATNQPVYTTDPLADRLSNALEEPETATYGRPPAPAWDALAREPAPGAKPAHQVWQGAPDVVIELGVPHQPTISPLPPAETAVRRPERGSIAFEPLPPADIRRAPARMPELKEFPEVGQRDYQAKRNPPNVPVDKGLGGLISRWTGRSRQSDSDSDESAGSPSRQRGSGAAADGLNRPPADAADRWSSSTARRSDEPPGHSLKSKNSRSN